jgi:hypothetical protein
VVHRQWMGKKFWEDRSRPFYAHIAHNNLHFPFLGITTSRPSEWRRRLLSGREQVWATTNPLSPIRQHRLSR